MIRNGWVDGFIGVLIFSASLPATKLAVSGFQPLFLTNVRASIAGILAAVALVALRERRPSAADLRGLALTALGVVVGFPLLTALALRQITSAQSVVFIGLLPLSTAVFAVLRGGERPRPAFWAFSVLGAALVVGFAVFGLGAGQGTVATVPQVGSTPGVAWTGAALMIGAILVCGFGYAEGARLSRRLGGWQVISWALVVSLPVMLPLAIATRPESVDGVAPSAWAGLAYVALFSMLIGFVFWYRGLAAGGAAAVGQLQLLQPFFGLAISALVLGETVGPGMFAVTLGVVACVAGAKRFAAR